MYIIDIMFCICLSDGVDSLFDLYSDWNFFEFFVKSDEELREYGGNDLVKYLMVFV